MVYRITKGVSSDIQSLDVLRSGVDLKSEGCCQLCGRLKMIDR